MSSIWVSPNRIIFTKKQILWLLENFEFSPDSWMPDYKETGYQGKNTGHKSKAYWETACCVWAELLQRIEKCWPDSAWLMLAVAYEDIEQVISNGENQDIRKIKRRINNALAYICGRKRKPYSYKEFKSHRKRKVKLIPDASNNPSYFQRY